MNKPYFTWEDYELPSPPDSFLLLHVGGIRLLLASVIPMTERDGPNSWHILIYDASRLGKDLPVSFTKRQDAKDAIESIYYPELGQLVDSI